MDVKTNLGPTAEDPKENLSLSDSAEDEEEDEHALPELHGTLSKWTNYIHGWQSRYIALKDGTLSYYKSENDSSYGCRGAVSLAKAVIQPHEFDECRFDVSINDNCLWYLRAESREDRQRWIDAILLHKQAESGYGSSENSLRRHDSLVSLTSGASMSNASASSFKCSERGRGLKEKLLEMETFRDILCRQVDTLQSYFDACASAIAHKTVHDLEEDIDDVDDFDSPSANGPHRHTFAPKQDDIVNILQQHGAHAIDFKGESFTFKATTAGILSTLSHCIELMAQREEAWKKRLEREVEKRKKVEEAYKHMSRERSKPVHVFGGPDFEEGPHSCLNEEEFFDAVDASLDKLEKEQEERLSLKHKKASEPTIHERPPNTSLDPNHPLYEEIERVVKRHIQHTNFLSAPSPDWDVIEEDGDMKMYRCEMETEDGIVIDPIKAVHTVKGITGHEFCHYFWDPKVRMEWETMIDSCEVVDWLSEDTLVTYQLHKRVWPTTQRDSLFWSTMRHAESEDGEGPDYWVVVNYTCDHEKAPRNKFVRVHQNVALICETMVAPTSNYHHHHHHHSNSNHHEQQSISREDVSVRIQYTITLNPGGWAPASVIRAISKRECPKFLRNFTAYVQEKTHDKPIMF